MSNSPTRAPALSPEDLLDPAAFPSELAWVPAHYKLNPTDPVYLLLAWHWRRIQQSEDAVQAGIVELKANLDARIDALVEAAETVTGVNEALSEVQTMFEEKPSQLSEQLDRMLALPIESAIGKIEKLERSLVPIARAYQASNRRLLFATLLIGVAIGALSAAILLVA